MIPEEIKERVRLATVKLPNLGGQGVLVPGNYILTAAHCVELNDRSPMDEHWLEKIVTSEGQTFQGNVVAAETRADLAALGPADDDELPEDNAAFAEFASAVEGIPLYAGELPQDEPVPIHVLSHLGKWIPGSVIQTRLAGVSGRIVF